MDRRTNRWTSDTILRLPVWRGEGPSPASLTWRRAFSCQSDLQKGLHLPVWRGKGPSPGSLTWRRAFAWQSGMEKGRRLAVWPGEGPSPASLTCRRAFTCQSGVEKAQKLHTIMAPVSNFALNETQRLAVIHEIFRCLCSTPCNQHHGYRCRSHMRHLTLRHHLWTVWTIT